MYKKWGSGGLLPDKFVYIYSLMGPDLKNYVERDCQIE